MAALKPVTDAGAAPCNFTVELQGPVRAMVAAVKPISALVDEWYNGYTLITQPPKEVVIDAGEVGDAASEAAHGLQCAQSGTGQSRNLQWRDAVDGGYVQYVLKVDGTQRCYLRVLYDGDATSDGEHSRVFDLQALRPDGSYVAFATQSLDVEVPGGFHSVLYPLPLEVTQGHSAVTIRFQSKGFNGLPGAMGPLYDQLSARVMADS